MDMTVEGRVEYCFVAFMGVNNKAERKWKPLKV